MHDVARHAGVSQRTVSNVVNNYKHVSPEMRRRVEASLEALGYRPNVAARQLRGGRTGTVTLAIPDFKERYFVDLAEAVVERAAEIGQRVLIETTAGDAARERALLATGGGQLTDGLVIAARTIEPEDDDLVRAGFPVVVIGDRESVGGVDHVGIPNRPAARAAVEHLLTIGRRRLAVLGGPSNPPHIFALRRSGVDEALEAAGLAPDVVLEIPVGWGRVAGERAMDELLSAGGVLPDGIFAMNDSVAMGAMRSLQRAGVRVPDDVAIVGFDDIWESAHALPSLTTISASYRETAVVALELIAEQFAARGAQREHQHRYVGFELKVRGSTIADLD
ncbi:LacI family DNA-binding transcriptional regulator [Diaminobutyricimonas aerilata]